MPHTTASQLSLRVTADITFLSVATRFVEESAMAFGLAKSEALGMTLASEEVFLYLSNSAAPKNTLEICIKGKGFYVETEFTFEADDLDLRSFNITSSANLDSEEVEETGLLIASRMIDKFRLSRNNKIVTLVLIKEKSYPPGDSEPIFLPDPDNYHIRNPEIAEVKLLVQTAWQRYSPPFVHPDFAYPGKIADMITYGEVDCLVACDKMGHLFGAVFWENINCGTVEMCGPYVFSTSFKAEIAHDLTEKLIASIAKSGASGLINRHPTKEMPTDYFEQLGSLTFYEDSGPLRIPAFYREMKEDLGIPIWSHQLIEPFLEAQYKRLFLPRQMRSVTYSGEESASHSVFFTEIDAKSKSAIIQPIVFGRDVEQSLAAHISTLKSENLPTIFFDMDLGVADHCRFAPALYATGFQPAILIPYGKSGDVLVFQDVR